MKSDAMPIVTLTTDLGYDDHYAALLKGGILSRVPEASIIDITHNVKAFDIVQAALLLRSCWREFPAGSIHIVSVNDLGMADPSFVCIDAHDHYFIGPDNGIFSLLFDRSPSHIVRLRTPTTPATFPQARVCGEAVRILAHGGNLHRLGTPTPSIDQRMALQPVINKNLIQGSVIHIDHYQNAVANISRDLFDRTVDNRPFSVIVKRHPPIQTIHNTYAEVTVGETLCLFNSANLLEIAINAGKAAGLLSIEYGDPVRIIFD